MVNTKKIIKIVNRHYLKDFEEEVNRLVTLGWEPKYESFHSTGNGSYVIALTMDWGKNEI